MAKHLQLTRFGNGGWLLVLDRAAAGPAGLNGADNLHGLDVAFGNAAKDDVLAIEPRGDNGGDEELGSVAGSCQRQPKPMPLDHVRVGASVGHGQKEGPVVPQLEVLVRELLAVDGLATGAL